MNNEQEYHKSRIAFMIINDEIIFLEYSIMSHREWYESLSLKQENFKKIVRGYILENKAVFYKGEFFLDKFHGFGIKFYPNRNYYQGNFKNNLRDGEGSLFYKNGKPKYKGIFKLDKCDSPNDDFDQDGNE